MRPQVQILLAPPARRPPPETVGAFGVHGRNQPAEGALQEPRGRPARPLLVPHGCGTSDGPSRHAPGRRPRAEALLPGGSSHRRCASPRGPGCGRRTPGKARRAVPGRVLPAGSGRSCLRRRRERPRGSTSFRSVRPAARVTGAPGPRGGGRTGARGPRGPRSAHVLYGRRVRRRPGAYGHEEGPCRGFRSRGLAVSVAVRSGWQGGRVPGRGRAEAGPGAVGPASGVRDVGGELPGGG